MQDGDAMLRSEPREGRLELERFVHCLVHELLDDRLAPRAEGAAAEASAEAPHAREADTMRLEGVAVEHAYASVGEDRRQLVLLIGFVVVVSEHRDDRDLHRRREIAREYFGFFRKAVEIGRASCRERE